MLYSKEVVKSIYCAVVKPQISLGFKILLNIKIESNLLGSQFRIINALGQEVKQGELSNLNSTIDVSKLPKGSYNMFIGTENYSHPFLVE